MALIAIAALAVGTLKLMINSTRRQEVEDASPNVRKPSLGSPAQVWVSRGEKVLRELSSAVAEHGALHGVSGDAAQVVAELRTTAGQVAEIDHALSQIPVVSLEQQQTALRASLAEAQGKPAEEDLARSYEAVSARLAAAQRQREVKEALVARMQATVTGFEQARDELTELTASTTALDNSYTGSAAELTTRLHGLREGLVEVRQLSNPERGPEQV